MRRRSSNFISSTLGQKLFSSKKKPKTAVNKLFPAYLVVPSALNKFASYGLESHLSWLTALCSPLHREQLGDENTA